MCSPSPPPPPDYTGAAQAQGAANLDAAIAQGHINNPNVVGPYGSQTVTWNGNDPTITQRLSPEQQALYGKNNLTQQQLADLGFQGAQSLQGVVGKPLDLSGAPAAGQVYTPGGAPTALDTNGLPAMPGAFKQASNMPAMPQNSQAIRDQVINAMMGRANSDIGKHQDQVNSDLIAAGIRPGTEAYAREMDLIGRQRNDALQQAQIAGGDAAAQAYGMDLSTRQEAQGENLANEQARFNTGMGIRTTATGEQAQKFNQQGQALTLQQQQQAQQYAQQSAARQAKIAEILAQRQTPMNEISALRSGSQVANPFSMPGAAQNTNVAPAPVFGATQAQGQYGTDIYNAKVGSSNSTNQAVGSIASAAIMAAMFY